MSLLLLSYSFVTLQQFTDARDLAAISCTDELLQGLGDMLAKDPSLPCQTHLAENPTEIEFTKCTLLLLLLFPHHYASSSSTRSLAALFPFAESYTAVYDHFGLLKDNTVLAHCVHLDTTEMDLIKSRESGISHCPKSVQWALRVLQPLTKDFP